jgi:thioredoxin reductase (NADPH)
VKKLLVIGAGPAGLSVATQAASEGLAVTVLEKSDALGGQFRQSFDIENFPGVPKTTGRTLSSSMINQAKEFGVQFICPAGAAGIYQKENGLVVETEDLDRYDADAICLALGLQYRRVDAPGLAEYMGRGVYCGPGTPRDASPVMIVGGGNSAGQEAMKMASDPARQVYLLIRSKIEDRMSSYLVDIVRKLPNVEVIEGEEIVEAKGFANWLDVIRLTNGRQIVVGTLMLYVGAVPHTRWLKGSGVRLNSSGFIMTKLASYATTRPGVFAIGDARLNSVKRIGAAVGEGCMVMPEIHEWLARPVMTTRDIERVVSVIKEQTQ